MLEMILASAKGAGKPVLVRPRTGSVNVMHDNGDIEVLESPEVGHTIGNYYSGGLIYAFYNTLGYHRAPAEELASLGPWVGNTIPYSGNSAGAYLLENGNRISAFSTYSGNTRSFVRLADPSGNFLASIRPFANYVNSRSGVYHRFRDIFVTHSMGQVHGYRANARVNLGIITTSPFRNVHNEPISLTDCGVDKSLRLYVSYTRGHGGHNGLVTKHLTSGSLVWETGLPEQIYALGVSQISNFIFAVTRSFKIIVLSQSSGQVVRTIDLGVDRTVNRAVVSIDSDDNAYCIDISGMVAKVNYEGRVYFVKETPTNFFNASGGGPAVIGGNQWSGYD